MRRCDEVGHYQGVTLVPCCGTKPLHVGLAWLVKRHDIGDFKPGSRVAPQPPSAWALAGRLELESSTS